MRRNVLPSQPDAVPSRRRRKVPHPLRGTPIALRYRRARRWLAATMLARRHNARLPADAPTLNFFPHRPHAKTQVTRILALLGVRIGFDVAGRGPVILWDQGAWFGARHAAQLPAGAINARCRDVSKSTVQRVFGETAGYSLAVDPLVHQGAMVVKSELNGMHDGQVVDGPLRERQAGRVYERLVDTREQGVLTTIRVPIVGRHVPVTMLKWRRVPHWFSGTALTEPRQPDDVFSAAEIALMLRFAAGIGMDYGELDVLRDVNDGLIYIVDANRTPMRNPGMESRFDGQIYPPMAEAFRELLAR